ncbi:hypothetical protein CFP56_004277 [Quercus suber]|uniref:Protein Lines C-terminal domain-containing protein n=1 Tax=Quercus suber TaxID=58331 RepID=A0AAW0LC81_QUESU
MLAASSSSSSNCSRLCRLIDDSLDQFTVHHTYHSHSTSVSSLPKDRDKEKQILIALSEVLKQIQLWTPKLNAYYSHSVKDLESASCSGGCASHSDEDNHCLANIVAHLIVLLTLENQYIQHLAGNVLSFISEFVATSKTNWDGFIHLVCVCLELAINNTLSYPSAPSSSEAEDFNSDSSKFDDVIRPRLTNANWCTVAGIIRVLRNILKYLKREDDGQLLEKTNWDGFIHLVCVCLELAINNTLSYPSAPSSSEAEDFNSDSSKFDDVIRPRLTNANWCTVAGIIRVLRNILKYLKREDDGQLLEVYLNSVDSCLSNVHWDLFEEVHVGQNSVTQKNFCADALFFRNISGCHEPSIIFLGNFLQLLCSLVDESDFMEAAGGCIDKHPIRYKIINLVPKVLYWCLGKEGDYVDTCISQYFRHKLLDDILFKMLLQLLGIPFCTEQQYHKEKGTFQDVNEDNPSHVSNLHYDHEVLLDYLISKDIGISCAEYLLRCLRIICDSWSLFVEFLLNWKDINQSSCKKRKVSLDGSNFGADVTPMLVKNNGIITSQEKEYERDHRYGSQHYITKPFEEAKECLLSLRNSVESLHKKNLFPYNPTVLLKRWVVITLNTSCFQ